MTIQLLTISILRTFVEVALLSLIGQTIVGIFSGESREQNFIYRIFSIITRPPIRALRLIMPKLIIDKHIPVVTFFVLLWLWILLAYVKRSISN